MIEILSIIWFVGLLLSILLVHWFVGNAGLVAMFPEGRRWWMTPASLLSLAAFAAVVHFHPF